MTRIHAPLALLREVMERQLMQGKLDEAAEIGLRILPYDHPRLRPRKEPDAAAAATAKAEHAALKAAAKRLGLAKEHSALMTNWTRSLQQQLGSDVNTHALAVVEQAITQHLIAGRLPEATALAARLAPYAHARVKPVDADEKSNADLTVLTNEELDLLLRLMEAI